MLSFHDQVREHFLNPTASEVRGIIFDGNVETLKQQAADAAWEWGGIDQYFDSKVAELANVGVRCGDLDREERRIFGMVVTQGRITARGLFWVAFEQALGKDWSLDL